MTEQQFNTSHPQQPPSLPTSSPPIQFSQPLTSIDEFLPLLGLLRRPRRHLTAAPTFTPKTFAEQIQFYDDGTNRRLYTYLNGVWRYVALT